MFTTSAIKPITPSTVGDTIGTIYTVPALTGAILQGLIFHNTGVLAVAVDLHLVPDGDSATDANKVAYIWLEENMTESFAYKMVMEDGGTIQVLASIDAVVSANGSVVEFVSN